MKGRLDELVLDMGNFFVQYHLIRNEDFSTRKTYMDLYRSNIVDKYSLEKGQFTSLYAQARQRNTSVPNENPDLCPGYWR